MGQKKGTRYFLKDNPFKDDGTFIANTVIRENVDLEDIIRRMVDRGTTLTEIDLAAVIRLFKNEILNCMAEGKGVNIDDFFTIRTTISGIFDDETDSYDKARHSLKANINVSSKFSQLLASRIIVEKVDTPERVPKIQKVYDQFTETINEQLTVGNVVRLRGSNLFFDRKADDEGVFLVNKEATSSIKITYRDTISNKELRFLVPQEATTLGEEVYIELRSRLKTKHLRLGRQKFTVKVVTA